jgi:GntR family transcriptional regulator, transcriptional repressor for pyruvate dehydrogenase complex
MLTQPRPEKAAMIVAQSIVGDIADRGLRVGDRLPQEREMIQQYGVSRSTLREALRFLELQGVLSLRPGPGGGPTVTAPDGVHLATALTLLMQFEGVPFRTIVEARTGLEPQMARLSADRMRDEELAELAAAIDEMERRIDDKAVFLRMNKRFHEMVAHGSGNKVFGYLVDAIGGTLAATEVGADYPPDRRVAVLAAHKRIFQAIAAHDREAAAEAMLEHILQNLRYAEKLWPDIVDAPITWRPRRY